MRRALLFVFLLLGWHPWVTAGEMRTWTDRSRNYRVKAEIVAYEKGKVTLKTAEGKTIVLNVSKLSKGDREVVYKFHNPDYGKPKVRKKPAESSDSDTTTPSPEEEGKPDPRRRGKKGSPAAPRGREKPESSSRDGDVVPVADFDRDEVPTGDPSEAEVAKRVTVTGRAERDHANSSDDARPPFRLTLTLDGEPANVGVAYGHVRIGRFVDQAGTELSPLFQFLAIDPRTGFVPLESLIPRDAAERTSDATPTGDEPLPGGTDEPATRDGRSKGADAARSKEIVWDVGAQEGTVMIAELSGLLTLQYASDHHTIAVEDVQNISGPVDSPELAAAGLRLRLEQPAPDRMEAVIEEGSERLVQVSLADARGVPVRIAASNVTSTEGGARLTWTLPGPLTPGAKLIVQYARTIQTVDVPFNLSEIPIRSSE